MKKLGRYIIRNWLWIALGCVLTRKAVELAYLERGYKAVGGEWCVLPIILLAVEICRGMFCNIAELTEKEDC